VTELGSVDSASGDCLDKTDGRRNAFVYINVMNVTPLQRLSAQRLNRHAVGLDFDCPICGPSVEKTMIPAARGLGLKVERLYRVNCRCQGVPLFDDRSL
jgi:hypothetical protein